MNGEHRYKEGDKLVVVDEPVMNMDKIHAGRKVTLTSNGYNGSFDRIIYNARFDDGSDHNIIFFDSDLRRQDNSDRINELKAEIARLEAEDATDSALAKVREASVGSNVFIHQSNRGSATLYTKVAENKWRWYYVGDREIQYHSFSGTQTILNDIEGAINSDIHWEFFPADKD